MAESWAEQVARLESMSRDEKWDLSENDMRDVDDMMGALRLVASEDTSIETVRAIAKAALARLATRGIGDGAGVSSAKAE